MRPTRRLAQLSLLAACLLAAPGLAWASGGYGGGNVGGGNGYRGPTRSDAAYDAGKALAFGRSRQHRGLRVCLAPAAEAESAAAVSLSRKTLSNYRGASIAQLAESLVDCRAAERRVQTVVSREELESLLYYLNKRYRLGLRA